MIKSTGSHVAPPRTDLSLEAASSQSMRGVVFARSIRSFSAALHVACYDCAGEPSRQPASDIISAADHHYSYVLVSIKFHNDDIASQLRSFCRRRSKLGDMLRFQGGRWVLDAVQEHDDDDDDNDEEDDEVEENQQNLATAVTGALISRRTRPRRFELRVWSLEQAESLIETEQVRYWTMPQCQAWQQQYRQKKRSTPSKVAIVQNLRAASLSTNAVATTTTTPSQQPRHGGALGKKIQSERLANFLIHMITHKDVGSSSPADEATARPAFSYERAKAIQKLNAGSGVLDVAGGAGYVSMALGLQGVKSTVMDPRESVGILPKRDRKVWYRALKKSNKETAQRYPLASDDAISTTSMPLMLCQPVAPYTSVRAWFGQPPKDVDLSIKDRHSDTVDIPVCSDTDKVIQHCSAIVALHPDEATDAVVDVAVKHRIPIVIVPCCVFSRLFPERHLPGSDEPVCTYDQLLEYLVAKDKSIQRTVLPFEGANVVLWSTFESTSSS